MEDTNNPRENHTASGHQGKSKTNKELLKENSYLLQEVSKLKDLLDQERNASRDGTIIALTLELEETKQMLLKKNFLCKKNKQLRRKLEEAHADIVTDYIRLERRFNAEQDTHHQKMAKYMTSVQQNATKRESSLIREVQEIKIQLDQQISQNNELCNKLEAKSNLPNTSTNQLVEETKDQKDKPRMERSMDDLQRELEDTREAHKYMITAYKSLGRKLKGELESLRQKMAEDMTSLQRNASERESSLLREMEEIKIQLDRQISLNIELSDQLKARSGLPNTSTSKVVEETKDQGHKPLMIKLITLPKEEPQVPTEEPCIEEMPTTEPTTKAQEQDAPKRPSFFKRARHFLGLKKPQRWKKRRDV